VKYFNLLIRVIIVGIVWTIVYGVVGRTLIYSIWGFDPAYNRHWIFLWQMWQDGWVIDTTPEWIFLFVILLFIPVWLIGWLLLSKVKWGQILWNLCKAPLSFLRHIYNDRFRIKTLIITRRKSYRRIRPNPLPYFVPSSTASAKPKKNKKRKDGKDSEKMYNKMDELSGQKGHKKARDAEYMPDEDDFTAQKEKEKESDASSSGLTRKEILDSLHQSVEKNNEKNQENNPEEDSRRFAEAPTWDTSKEERIKPSEVVLTPEEEQALKIKSHEDSRDMLKVRGFKVLENVDIDGIKVDFIGLSEDSVLLCKFDDVKGDWLADEDSVNNENPSWFCEDIHRESPAFMLITAGQKFKETLKLSDKVSINYILAIEGGNVINAPDMAEVWEEENISVCRVGTGKPVSLPHFVEIIPEAYSPADNAFVKKCKNTFKIG